MPRATFACPRPARAEGPVIQAPRGPTRRRAMARNKVTVVGAGNVGATTAQRIAEAGLADVVLVDIVEGLPQGKGLDIAESAPWTEFSSTVRGTNNWADTADSDSVVTNAVQHSPNAVLVIFANPMDAMCHVALEASGFPKERVIGQGGMLDTTRYRTFISMETGASTK